MTQTLPKTSTRPRKAARTALEPPPVVLPAPGTAPPCVVGVDLSLTATGVAWSNGETITYGRDGLTSSKLFLPHKAAQLRVLAIDFFDMIVGRTGAGDITMVGIEMLPTSGTRAQSERCYVWWEVIRALGATGVPVIDIPPSLIKLYITGNGDANKREMLAAVQRLLPQFDITKRSPRTGKVLKGLDDNKADAAVIVAILCDLLGHPLCVAPGRRALDKIQLPEGVRR